MVNPELAPLSGPEWEDPARVDPRQLARLIDHTLLAPGAGAAEIRSLCEEARAHGFYSVCVNPSWIELCVDALEGSGVTVCTVLGFPLGATRTSVKAFEGERSVQAGATELDMVLPIGRLRSGDHEAVERDIATVVGACPTASIKVILETALLDDEEIRTGCSIAKEAGAHFVKTSTGFGGGGATVEHVALMRAVVGPGVGVKASGGVRSVGDAVRMVQAGANRLGTSSGVRLVSGEA